MPLPAAGEFIVTIISDMDDTNRQQNSVMYVEAAEPTTMIECDVGGGTADHAIEISDEDVDASCSSEQSQEPDHKRKRKRGSKCKFKAQPQEEEQEEVSEAAEQIDVIEEYIMEEDENPLMCIFCKTEFDTSIDLKQHYWIEHELDDVSAKQQQQQQPSTTTATTMTRKRVDMIRELFDLTCELCTAQPFQNHNILKEHYDKVHQMRRMYIVCRTCNIKVKTVPSALNEHIRWHVEPDFLR